MKCNLILGGSGAVFPIFLGVLKGLERQWEVSEIICTSGGSVVSSLFSSPNNYSLANVEEILKSNAPSHFVTKYTHSMKRYWKTGSSLCNSHFKQMLIKYCKYPVFESRCDIQVTAIKENLKDIEVFSKNKNGSFCMSDVVLASCAIPHVFSSVQIGSEKYVDGGWIEEFPVMTFKNPELPTFVFRVKETETSWLSDKIMTLGHSYLYKEVKSLFVDTHYDYFICDLKSNHSKGDFKNLTPKKIQALIEEGYRQCQKFLKITRESLGS